MIKKEKEKGKKKQKKKEEKFEDEDEEEEEEEEDKPKAKSGKKSIEGSTSKTVASKGNTIRVPKTSVKSKVNTTNKTKIGKPTGNKTSSVGKTRTVENINANKISQKKTTLKESSERKPSLEKRTSGTARGGSSSAGKRANSATKKGGASTSKAENEAEFQDFKKILARNRVDKVKNDKEKVEYLKNIISDYLRYKEIDKYFKNMMDTNPIFKGLSSKIMKNIKKPKEFSLRKLNAINALIASGDKNAFINFMKIKEKDKINKNYFDIMKKSFNNLLKLGPLKNLTESDVSNYCKIVLDFPEFSVQVSKDLLKYAE